MTNYFELYQIPISLNPNKAIVKQQYFQLSRQYHPDFITNGTEMEQQEALEISSQVNKAFKIFNHQDETIQYVLQLKDILQADEKYNLPKDFLMEMMELNEALMDAKFEENEEKIETVKLEINNWQSVIKKDVENIINDESIENAGVDDLEKVKEYYFKKKYLNRILDSIK
ncbi:MAG: Fe-S protein assembly co-chaperone HscB [Bacteroidetes bacterium]|jgi:molecular chaperone HscB|nr:Fe-S protein assembly co-chaperone HscB [Bacteroidota bacterium]